MSNEPENYQSTAKVGKVFRIACPDCPECGPKCRELVARRDDPAIYAPWLGTDKKTVAMVRDTPENVAELAAIVRGLAALNNRMHRVFSPSSLPRALAERRLRWLDPAGVPKISQDSTGGGE